MLVFSRTKIHGGQLKMLENGMVFITKISSKSTHQQHFFFLNQLRITGRKSSYTIVALIIFYIGSFWKFNLFWPCIGI